MTDASDFMRYFVNVPTKRESGQFVKGSVWNALAEEGLEIAEEADVCLGLDGSRTFDTTVVVWAEQREDGTIAVDACVFSARAHVAHHVLHEGGKIDFEDVEAFTIDRFDLFDVREVAYDPRYLERSAELVERRLPDSLIFPVEPCGVRKFGPHPKKHPICRQDQFTHPTRPVSLASSVPPHVHCSVPADGYLNPTGPPAE